MGDGEIGEVGKKRRWEWKEVDEVREKGIR